MSRNRNERSKALDKSFVDLQNKWYDKLKASGFKDLEWTDRKTGKPGHNDLFTDGRFASQMLAKYSPQAAYFYSVVQNYYTHNWNGELRIFRDARQQYAIREMIKGVSYRDMVAAYNKRAQARRTGKIYTFLICRTIQKFTKMAFIWNDSNPEGVRPEGSASLDFHVEDILLKD